MSDRTPGPTAREAAAQALRRATKGDSTVPWGELSDTRREMWCDNADPVVYAALRVLANSAADTVARELYREHHERAGTLNRWTMSNWDHGGDQHVNKVPWRMQAKTLIRMVESTYREEGGADLPSLPAVTDQFGGITNVTGAQFGDNNTQNNRF